MALTAFLLFTICVFLCCAGCIVKKKNIKWARITPNSEISEDAPPILNRHLKRPIEISPVNYTSNQSLDFSSNLTTRLGKESK
jgi:hypothetical protein